MSARTTTVRKAARPSTAATSSSRSRHPTSSAAPRRPPRRRAAARQVARRPAPLHAYLLVAVVAVLTLLGLVMVLSASSVTALHLDGSSWTYFKRQAVWMVLGVVAFGVTTKVPYHTWRRFVGPLLTVSFIAMALVLMPSIGREVNGARAWFSFGPLGFQPAELMKVALLLYSADLLARRADRMHEVRLTFVPLLVVLSGATLLILLQPDLGGAMVLAGIVLGVAFIAGTPLLPFTVTVAGIGGVGALFMLRVRAERWTAFLDLAAHKQDDGFQVWQSLVGIASGGLTGVGLGAGKAKWGYLPEAHTDFIFAIIAEELGFAGVAIVLSLFLVLVWLGIRIALRAPDRFGTLLAGGITAWILVQTLINVGGVVGLMPLTGLTLPFVSFGGSSLLVTMAAAGLLLNIARGRKVTVFAVIAGGGTAGHVVPALAIADALVARGHGRDDLLFVGAARGMEASMVPAAGYQVALLPVEGVRRSMSPANARAAARFSSAVPRSVALLRRVRPQVVVSVGGYASVPAVTAAWMLRIPLVVVSYDVVPGAAARLQSRLAAVTAVAFESSPLPGKAVTGAPLRPEILGVDRARDRASARSALGLPQDRFTLVVVGGSLGSGKLNEVTASFVAARRDDRQLAVHHVLGQRQEATGVEPQAGPDGIHYQTVRYEDRMHLAYAAADIVLGRAGATTVAELAAVGTPSVLVPWPLATEDHQTANAKVLADVGGAVLVPEAELSADRLAAVLEPFRQEPARLDGMSVRARSAGRRDGAERIADLVERYARQPR